MGIVALELSGQSPLAQRVEGSSFCQYKDVKLRELHAHIE